MLSAMSGIKRKVLFGVETPAEGIEFDVLKAHALEAEKLGYNSVWLVDHILTVAFPHGNPQPDTWTTMSALLASTSTIRVGAMVLCNAFRHAPLMANAAATLDRISKGRLEFAIGAGWYEQEFHAYGYPFPKPAIRMAQLEEALQVFKKMWTEESASFEGKYYTIRDIRDCPKPYQQPHPPIWIGGSGEKKLLRLVAKYGDKWNAPQLGPDEIAHKIEVLEQHCQDVGRDPSEIEKTWWGSVFIDEDEERLKRRLERAAGNTSETRNAFYRSIIAGTPDQVTERLMEFVKVGVSQFVMNFGRVADLRGTQTFAATVMPKFRDVTVG